MKEKNITALVSSFVRYYHHKNSNIKVYDDKNCDKVLTFEEYLNFKENIDEEHICCAIGDPKHQDGVNNKKKLD